MCPANSSTISISRSAESPGGIKLSRTYVFQSLRCSLISRSPSLRDDTRHAVERGEELAPGIALRGEHFSPFRCQLVIAAAALPGLLHPLPLNPSAFLHPVEQRVQRSYVELQHPPGPLPDQLRDLIAVPRGVLDQRQDQQFSTPLFQLLIYHSSRSNMLRCHIYTGQSRKARAKFSG